MAVYIPIRKVAEDSHSARYAFGEPGTINGLVSLDKASGTIVTLEGMTNDDATSRVLSRVEHKLRQHWQRGEYPELTCWAS